MNSQLKTTLTRRIRVYILIVIAGLFISGVTAFPLQTELALLTNNNTAPNGQIAIWLDKVYAAVKQSNQNYPFLSYGTDWLAFAHIMLAILFIGPFKNPVKNVWVVQFGIIAALMIFPLAFIAGNVRHIPFFWQLVDCSFGVITLLVLIPCYKSIIKLEKLA